MRIFWVKEIHHGSLGMMPRPRGGDWLEEEVKMLKQLEIDVVVSLLEKKEAESLLLEKEAALCQRFGIDFINYPIRDRQVPDSKRSFLELVSVLDSHLLAGRKVVIHCRMGIGRTSMLAAGVLLKNDARIETVFDLLTKYRTLTVPDTEEQKLWIKELVGSGL
ncbi:MAG: dual specificity protein phosphatase family protein [Bacteroidota bacterium]